MKSLPILLAIDFDETIVNSHPPEIKSSRKGAKKYINKLVNQGYYVTIWTCRTDKGFCNDETAAKRYLHEQGIMYHDFNENHIALQKCFGNNCRKISCDFYIDDKGLWLFKIPSWFWLYWIIRFKSFFLKDNRKIMSHCKPEHYN